MTLTPFAIAALPAAMAFLYRWRGGGLPGTLVAKMLYAAAMASPLAFIDRTVFALGALGALGAVTLGHGEGLRMGRAPFIDRRNALGALVRPVFAPGTYGHAAAFMFLSGALYAAPTSLALAYPRGAYALGAIAFAGSGLAKIIAYEAAWRWRERKSSAAIKSPLPLAEIACGFLQGLVIAGVLTALG